MNIQKNLTDQILINDHTMTTIGASYIPVVIYECNRDKTGQKDISIVMTDKELTPVIKSAVKNAAYTGVSQIKWSQTSPNLEEIKSEFSKLLSNSSKSQRTKELAARMFQKNNYLTI